MKKFSYLLVIIFSLFIVVSVKADSLKIYLNNLTYNSSNMLMDKFYSSINGNKTINFGYLLDDVIYNKWLYNSFVICTDATYSSSYIPSSYSSYMKNLSISKTNYSCSFTNSGYTAGKVVIMNFMTYIGAESGGDFSGSFVVYQDNTASYQLIDFVVNPNNFVKSIDYSSQTAINQNSQIINQNTTIINQNNQQLQEQQETNDKLDTTNQELGEMNDFLQDDTPASTDDVGIDSLGTVSGLLPEGPVDSLLNIPFTFLSVLISSMGGVCVPITGTWVFDSTLSIPCFDSFYNEVPSYLMNFINLIPSGFILILYFKHLYKKVDRAVSLETNSDDEWGVI